MAPETSSDGLLDPFWKLFGLCVQDIAEFESSAKAQAARTMELQKQGMEKNLKDLKTESADASSRGPPGSDPRHFGSVHHERGESMLDLSSS